MSKEDDTLIDTAIKHDKLASEKEHHIVGTMTFWVTTHGSMLTEYEVSQAMESLVRDAMINTDHTIVAVGKEAVLIVESVATDSERWHDDPDAV